MQATRTGQLTVGDYLERSLREGALWLLLGVALYLLLALASYVPTDPGWSYVGVDAAVLNIGGRAGAWFADVALFLFGLFAYLVPPMIAWSGYLAFRRDDPEPETKLLWLALRWVGFVLGLVAATALASLQWPDGPGWLPNGVGGGLGLLGAEHGVTLLGADGGRLALIALLFVGLSLLTGLSPLLLVDSVGELAIWIGRGVLAWWSGLRLAAMDAWAARGDWDLRATWAAWGPRDAWEDWFARRRASAPAAESVPAVRREPLLFWSDALDGDGGPDNDPDLAAGDDLPAIDIRAAESAVNSRPAPPAAPGRAAAPAPRPATPRPVYRAAARNERQVQPPPPAGGIIPPLELLDAPRHGGKGYSAAQLESLSRDVESRLADFGVVAHVVEVHPGPVVTLFELELAPGVKASKITGLAKDIARALSKVSVRVVEIIPGKSVIGLEIPNDERDIVVLRQVLGGAAYQEAKSPLSIGMGTNIAGQPVVADLGRMPHALIAGTTGSGKSVAINAMILSLVYKASPDEVRLIMVDPKMLELSVYEGIPHLLTPVVTDMKDAANALRWCVGEMERRYKLMSKLGVRNIAGYNRVVREALDAGEAIIDPLQAPGDFDADGEPATLACLPYIVVIIDELADMMMVVGKKVEELIARLAQKARASGIHLLLATQRPSVDVLTGLIKANIPTRMAFKVSSRIDSRTVLDQMGAEHLLGHGDMLYLPPGGSIPQRVHGAFVDDHEVHKVVDYLKQFGPPRYIDTVLTEPAEHLPGIDPEPRGGGGDMEDQDELFDEAVRIVVETRRASISGVQRRLKVGYNRAARMIEEMERIGIVGPAEVNGNREVLAPPPPPED